MLTGRQWANVRNKYLDFLGKQCEHINPRGIAVSENTVTLPLDAVYVSLRAEQKVKRYREWTHEEETQAILDSVWPLPPFREEFLTTNNGEQGYISHQSETVTHKAELYEVVQRERFAVLLGAPGAGKTTLMRFVTARFVEACRESKPQVMDGAGKLYGETRLPILLRVATYAEALRNNGNLSLREFLSLPFKNTGISDTERAEFFEAALAQGKALVLLDGLDEVATTADRAAIARHIDSFRDGLEAGCRVLVTSRIVGYAEVRLAGAFAEYKMLDMDDAQVEEFLDRWCVEVEKFQTRGAGEAENRRKGLEESNRLRQSIARSEGVRKLATNPLLLTILALIHRNQTRLPERRVELYRIASDTLLREWRRAGTNINGVEVTEAEAETLLEPLAYAMHNTVETGLLDREEARNLLCRFDAVPRGLSPKHPDVLARIDEFLTRVHNHSGLLVMHSTGKIGFLHLTFQEYFAARHLVNDFDAAKDLLRLHRHKARWEEPIRLALAMKSGSDAANLIRAALWHKDGAAATTGYEPDPYEDILRRDFLLTVRCMGDCKTIEATLAREVAEELASICLDHGGKRYYLVLRQRAYVTLPALASSEIGQELQRRFLSALQDNDSRVRESAVEALGQLRRSSSDVIVALQDALQDNDEFVRVSAALVLGQLGQASQDVVATLFAAMRGEEGYVEGKASEALGQLSQSSSDVIVALQDALQDNDDLIRVGVAGILGQLGNASEAVVSTLLNALLNQNAVVRYRATLALGKLGQSSALIVSALFTAFQDQELLVRQGAMDALGQIGQASSDVIATLLTALQDNNEFVRQSAASALGGLGNPSDAVTAALFAALNDEVAFVRVQAATALKLLGNTTESVVQTLLTAITDTNWITRKMAADALGQLGQASEPIVNALLYALKHNARDARRSAATALGRVGQSSEAVVAALLSALEDKDRNVQDAAWGALWTLTSDRAADGSAASD